MKSARTPSSVKKRASQKSNLTASIVISIVKSKYEPEPHPEPETNQNFDQTTNSMNKSMGMQPKHNMQSKFKKQSKQQKEKKEFGTQISFDDEEISYVDDQELQRMGLKSKQKEEDSEDVDSLPLNIIIPRKFEKVCTVTDFPSVSMDGKRLCLTLVLFDCRVSMTM